MTNISAGDRVRTAAQTDNDLPAHHIHESGIVVKVNRTRAIVKLDRYENPISVRLVDLKPIVDKAVVAEPATEPATEPVIEVLNVAQVRFHLSNGHTITATWQGDEIGLIGSQIGWGQRPLIVKPKSSNAITVSLG